MSGDGAHMGVGAGRALKTILGGEGQPSDSERRTPEQMRLYLLSAPPPPWDYDDEAGDAYGDCARWWGKLVLEAFDQYPELLTLPMEGTVLWDRDAEGRPKDIVRSADGRAVQLVRDVGDVLRDLGVQYPEGITGFQFGWGVNAARYATGAPAQANPAIMEIG